MNSPQPLSDEEKMALFKEGITSFEDVDAFYTEYPIVAHVRVSQVTATPDGIEAVITDLHTPGFGGLNDSPCKIGCPWAVFNFSKDYWFVPGPKLWGLRFDAEAIEILHEISVMLQRRSQNVSCSLANATMGNVSRARWEKLLASRRVNA